MNKTYGAGGAGMAARRAARKTALAATLAAALAAPASAAVLTTSNAGGQQMQVLVSGNQVAVDLRLLDTGLASLTVALEAADIGQFLRLNAVVDNSTGASLLGFQVGLEQAGFALVGSVTPQFGLLDGIEGDGVLQTVRFAPAEPTGFDLGDPFGRPGAADWLLVADGAAVGDTFTIRFNGVPEPSSLALAGLALAALARGRRKG